MSKRLAKKNLQHKIFGLMQNIDHCFSDGEFANTCIQKIKTKSYSTPDNRFVGIYNERFRPAEKLGRIEAKARQFLKDVESNKSQADFDRAIFIWPAEFDYCETGCVEALQIYIGKIDSL